MPRYSAQLIRDVGDVDPAWLTERLQTNGHLATGRVLSVEPTGTHRTSSSHIWHIEVNYSEDAPNSAPTRLVVKASNPKRSSVNNREVEFYTRVAPAMLNPPLVRCYDAVYSDEAKAYHLLLQDMSESHCAPEFPLPPTILHAELIVDALAEIHAHWWDRPELGEQIGEFPTESDINQFQ